MHSFGFVAEFFMTIAGAFVVFCKHVKQNVFLVFAKVMFDWAGLYRPQAQVLRDPR